MEEEELQEQHVVQDRFVPLLTSSLTVSTPHPPAFYDAELIRDGLVYRGKLYRDGGEDAASNADGDSGITHALRRFVIINAEQSYEGICFSDGAVTLHTLVDGETCSYRCLDHLLRFYFQAKKVTVNWLDE